MKNLSHCGACGEEFGAGRVLSGWTPCICGGHGYAWHRDDKPGGCGYTTYDPPILDETCRAVSFGYEGTSEM
jgi:hypothetical protein